MENVLQKQSPSEDLEKIQKEKGNSQSTKDGGQSQRKNQKFTNKKAQEAEAFFEKYPSEQA